MTFQIFTFIFIAIALTGFYLINPQYRWGFLAVCSLVFVYLQDPVALLALIGITVITYVAGLMLGKLSSDKTGASSIEKPSQIEVAYQIQSSGLPDRTGLQKIVFILTIILYVVLFAFWKIGSVKSGIFANIVLPIGFSFYTFQAISYLSDIYTGKTVYESNPVILLLYMSWFPKFVCGPIERSEKFVSQIYKLAEVRLFDQGRIGKALAYVTWGLFMKLMVADRAGIMVDHIFGAPEEYGSLMLILGSLLYTIQIYCDFAGYSYIAIGISNLFGIELSANFSTPYFSENISEFWKSWHMTLSSFLKYYVYIPLGGNRKGNIRKYANLLIVFIICGIWHGRGIKFIVWGMLHGFYSIITNCLKKTRLAVLFRGVIGIIVTFCGVSFAWIFFRAESFRRALQYIGHMAGNGRIQGFTDEIIKAGTNILQLIILVISVTVVFVCDFFASKKRSVPPEMMLKVGEVKRYTCFLLLAVITLIFGMYGNQEIKGFIYEAF